jgi:hypothetical protein
MLNSIKFVKVFNWFRRTIETEFEIRNQKHYIQELNSAIATEIRRLKLEPNLCVATHNARLNK